MLSKIRMKTINRLLKSRVATLRVICSRKPLILNYQSGKVGSSSVAEYLKQTGVHEWHLHRFFNTPIHDKQPKNKIFYFIDLFIFALAVKFCKRIYVVNGFREPVSRDIAMFFHSFEHNGENPEAPYKELLDSFHQKFTVGDSHLWYDREFNRLFGINIYDIAFDKDAGYVVFRRGNLHFFIYNLSKLDTLEPQLRDFFGLKSYRLIRANDSSDKFYEGSYKQFLSQYRLKNECIEKLRKSRFYSHFYDKDEIERSIERWQ